MNTSTYNYTKACVYLVVHHWTISKVPNLKHSAFEILIDDILYMENLVISKQIILHFFLHTCEHKFY